MPAENCAPVACKKAASVILRNIRVTNPHGIKQFHLTLKAFSDSIISVLLVHFEDLMFDIMLARQCWA